MAFYKDCIDAIKRAAGRELSDEEVEAIFEAIQERLQAEIRKGMGAGDAARKAAKDLSDEARLKALIERRSARINALRWEELNGRQVIGREFHSLQALVTGFQGSWGQRADLPYFALSADAAGHAAAEKSVGSLMADLRRAGLFEAVHARDSAFERDIAREIWRLDNPDAPGTGNAHAEQAAKIIAPHMELSRAEQNKAGAWIRKMAGYLGRQSHDMYKVRGVADAEQAFLAWREMIEPRLHERVFEGMETPAERTKFLKETWSRLASGLHDNAPSAEFLTGFKGFANLARQVSEARVLHFRDADAWVEYNAVYGYGTVLDSILHTIESGQRNAAIMRIFGTNPKAMLERLTRAWAAEARNRGDVAMADNIMRHFGKNSGILDFAMHKPAPIQNMTWANRGAMARNLQSYKLGGAAIASISDLAVVGAVARHNDIPALHGMASAVANLLPTESAARKDAAHEAGLLAQWFMNSISNRYMHVDGPPGAIARNVQTFMKWTGLNWWTAHMREAIGMSLLNGFARNGRKDFGALSARFQTTLRRYGIEEAEWNAIRSARRDTIDGDDFIFADAIKELPDEIFGGSKIPDVKDGFIRFYHGAPVDGNTPSAGGGRWVTRHYQYAKDYRASGGTETRVYYIDLPEDHPQVVAARAWDEADTDFLSAGMKTHHSFELTEEFAAKMMEFASGADVPAMVIERRRQALFDKYNTYIIDQTREALSEPTAGIRYFLTGGGQAAGSFQGEAWRLAMQFKSFPITMMVRSLAREVFRSGPDVGGIATLVAGSAVLGYVAMTLKDIAKGKEPRQPETLDDYKNLVIAAMAQGGGLGIYGDFLFGQSNRFFGGIAETLAGPSVSMGNDVLQVWKSALAGDLKGMQSEALQLAKQMPPMAWANLFYTRAATDYLIYWRIQEIINPGWARRFEQRVERENAQKMWLSPSEAVR